jgi:hypothetical protein
MGLDCGITEKEYDEFNKTQKIESDFDRFTKQVLDKKKNR